jgi:hypothetical protein
LKSLWILSAILLLIGFFVFIASSTPLNIEEAYTVSENQKHDYLITDSVQTATKPFYRTYYSATANFTKGDTISIATSAIDGQTPISAEISRYYGLEVYKSEENKTLIYIDYTIPFAGKFEVSVSRFEPNPYGLGVFTSETSAYVKITAQMTEAVQVQKYRVVTTYPYKGYESVGIGVMLAGIGVGVLSVSKRNRQTNQANNTSKSSTIPPPPYQKDTSNSKFCIYCGADIPLHAKFCNNCGKPA